MGSHDRDRAIDEALAGRAPDGHPDLDQVAAFAAQLRVRAASPVRRGPVPAIPPGDEPLYPLADRARRRRVPYGWAATAAAAVLTVTGVAAARPWQHRTTAAATTSMAEPPASSAAETVATTIPRYAEPSTVAPVETTGRSSSTAITERPTTPPPVPPKTEPTLKTPSTQPAPPQLPPGIQQARATWEVCAARGREAGMSVELIAAECGPEPNLTGYQAALVKWQECQRLPKAIVDTPVCGPAPNPNAFGFVSPWWAAP